MKYCGLAKITAAFIIVLGISFTISADTAPQTKFAVYDATQYKGKPDLTIYGIKPIQIYYVKSFYPGKNKDAWAMLPSAETVQGLAVQAQGKPGPVVLDLEQWPVDGVSAAEIRSNVAKYLTVLGWFQAKSPNLCVGYFSKFPIEFPHEIENDTYENPKDPFNKTYRNWLEKNNLVAPLAKSVCASFASAYTYDNDRAKWRRAFIAQVNLARSLFRGPVYAFLWPQYYDGRPAPKELRETYIPADYWKFQLETAAQYADGIVIWGGWDSKAWAPQQWDEDSGWWKETRTFLSR